MYNLNINIKQIAGKEEYCLILPTLASSSAVCIVKSIFIELFPNASPDENNMSDLIVNMLGLNKTQWLPPQSVYETKFSHRQDKPDVSGDIPLHLFDKVMQKYENTEPQHRDSRTEQENSVLPAEIIPCEVEMVETSEEKEDISREVDNKIVKVDISKYSLPKAADIVCAVCGKTFPSSVYLRRHFLNHSDSKDKPHYCRTCDEWISEKNIFEIHQNLHKERYVILK